MAQIISSEVTQDVPQGNGKRKVRYKFVCQANDLSTEEVFIGPTMVAEDFDAENWLPSAYADILVDLARKESEQLVVNMETTIYSLHDDQGAFYTKKEFKWGSWDEHTAEVLKYYLSRTDQLDLVLISSDLGEISNTDMRNLLGITNQQVSTIRANVQVALDIRAQLDSYSPLFDEDGVLI